MERSALNEAREIYEIASGLQGSTFWFSFVPFVLTLLVLLLPLVWFLAASSSQLRALGFGFTFGFAFTQAFLRADSVSPCLRGDRLLLVVARYSSIY